MQRDFRGQLFSGTTNHISKVRAILLGSAWMAIATLLIPQPSRVFLDSSPFASSTTDANAKSRVPTRAATRDEEMAGRQVIKRQLSALGKGDFPAATRLFSREMVRRASAQSFSLLHNDALNIEWKSAFVDDGFLFLTFNCKTKSRRLLNAAYKLQRVDGAYRVHNMTVYVIQKSVANPQPWPFKPVF